MDGFLAQHEGAIRLAVFFGVLAALALAETLAPRRLRLVSRGFRWLNNFALIAVGTVALRLFFPILAVAFAGVAQENGWGLFNMIDAPYWLTVAVSFAG